MLRAGRARHPAPRGFRDPRDGRWKDCQNASQNTAASSARPRRKAAWWRCNQDKSFRNRFRRSAADVAAAPGGLRPDRDFFILIGDERMWRHAVGEENIRAN